MMAASLPMNSFTTTSSPPILHQNMKTISTDQASTNNSNSSSIETPGVGMSCFTMTFGVISNLTALGILAKSRYRFRRQSKAPFLLLTVALLLADLGGHLILGSFALYMHTHDPESTTEVCKIFGTSMVFFGLCPLLFACAMAVERCVAITKPFFHISMITVAHAKVVIFFLSSIALVLAVLPLFSVGTYTIQTPYKWCFFPLENPQPADKKLSLAFSGLGLTALTLSLLCNILSGVVLLQARLNSSSSSTNSRSCSTRRASSVSTTSTSFFCSLDVEMMVQLATITVVSCVCWGPFLIHIHMMQLNGTTTVTEDLKKFILMCIRLAACNQILDPWVYILLRKTILLRLCCGYQTQRSTMSEHSFYTDNRRRALSLH